MEKNQRESVKLKNEKLFFRIQLKILYLQSNFIQLYISLIVHLIL